jgi:alcohol dehydrogenase
MMVPLDFQLRPRVVFGAGAFARLGALAADLGVRRALIVADRGLVNAGHVAKAEASLRQAGVAASGFHDFDPNPDGAMIERGRSIAAALAVDSIVGLGGGSSLDCAKGINLVLAGGGHISDYRGYGRATGSLLPMIGVPTTAGTGSEAQSYAVIADEVTHEKIACGDPGAAFRVVILDPCLTLSQPSAVAAAAGIDAISHAVECAATTRRTAVSALLAREAWSRLVPAYERVLAAPADLDARTDMQIGAFAAGLAVEHSMLGAAHACANPLTARHGTVHGVAIGVMLPHVVRWNREAALSSYRELLQGSTTQAVPGRRILSEDPAEDIAADVERFAAAGGLPRSLRDLGVPWEDLPRLAQAAAAEWTARFNPRPLDEDGALELYTWAY